VLLGGTVEREAGVVLLGDVGGDLDPDDLDDVALDVEPEDVAGVLAGLVGVVGQLHAARLAAATDLHLGLDDDRVADAVGDRDGVVDVCRFAALSVGTVGHGNAVLRKELLALILEQVHLGMAWAWAWAWPGPRHGLGLGLAALGSAA
jgi:hypothetical protein